MNFWSTMAILCCLSSSFSSYSSDIFRFVTIFFRNLTAYSALTMPCLPRSSFWIILTAVWEFVSSCMLSMITSCSGSQVSWNSIIICLIMPFLSSNRFRSSSTKYLGIGTSRHFGVSFKSMTSSSKFMKSDCTTWLWVLYLTTFYITLLIPAWSRTS